MTSSSRAKLPVEAVERIEDECATLAQVIESLEKQQESQRARFSREAERASELERTLQASASDEDKQLLASDESVAKTLRSRRLQELESMGDIISRPYFARVVLNESDPRTNATRRIEYKLGNRSNMDCRIVDWRKAPIAKLYYEYAEGDEYSDEIQGRERSGIVQLRHKVEIDSSELTSVATSLGTFHRDNGSWEQKGEFASRSRRSYSELPDVLSLITPEQYRLISEDPEAAVFLQGIAGSGKTTVALYRLAWLLHEDNSALTKEEAFVLVLSPSLRQYIVNSLPSLNIEGVTVLTFEHWAERTLTPILGHGLRGQRPRNPLPPRSRWLITCPAVLSVAKDYLADESQRTINMAQENLALIDAPKLEIPRNNQVQLKAGQIIELALKNLSGVKSPDAVEIKSIFNDQLSRLKDIRCTALKVLDLEDQITSADTSGLVTRELIRRTKKEVHTLIERREVDPAEDGLLMYLAQQTFELETAKAGHIVVDEVQDFSSMQLASVFTAVPKHHCVTLAGDTAQATSSYSSFPGWEGLRDFWVGSESELRFVELEVSHRSTVQIMRFADEILGERRGIKGRSGRRPLWIHCKDENDGVRQVIRWLTKVFELSPGNVAAVLTANACEASHAHSLLTPSFGHAVQLADGYSAPGDDGIWVSSIENAKGLEFPSVLIWNPSERSFPRNELNRHLLYVAATRAENTLGLISWNRPSRILPSLFSKLVRGYDRTEED